MYTVLWFSLGSLVWGALVALISAVVSLVVVAFTLYTSLALIGAVVFSMIGIRRRITGRGSNSGRGDGTYRSTTSESVHTPST